MGKTLLGVVALVGLLGLGVALGNSAVKGDDPAMMASPQTIVLAKVDSVTVHTNIPASTVAAGTLALIVDQAAPKGDVIAAARLAGILAAKRTHELIPLCHQLNLTAVTVEVEPDASLPGLRIVTEARLRGRTGVEMEALVAASVAALTVYDMCKAVDRGMEVAHVRLLEKRGGRSGHWRREEGA